MGWLIPYDTPHRKDLIARQVKDQSWTSPDGTKIERRALKHCYIGGRCAGTLYIVWEDTRTSATGEIEHYRFIEVDLLKYYPGREASWGFKDMTCCMGPNESKCPPSYLDMCPPHEDNGNDWCKNFHARSRAYWADRMALQRRKRANSTV